MGKAWLVGALAMALGGCKKDEPAAAPPASKSPVADAASARAPADAAPIGPDGGAAPDEAALRRDRKTGLGAADERPEVLVEDLVLAIAEGKVDAARFVDPARGYLEHQMRSGGDDTAEIQKRHCGKQAIKSLIDEARALIALQRDGAQDGPDLADHVLRCDNRHLVSPDPGFGARYDDDTDTLTGGHRLTYAVCHSAGGGELDANYELVFVPDPARGLRVVGSLTWESGVTDVPWPDFADAEVADEACP